MFTARDDPDCRGPVKTTMSRARIRSPPQSMSMVSRVDCPVRLVFSSGLTSSNSTTVPVKVCGSDRVPGLTLVTEMVGWEVPAVGASDAGGPD